MARSEDAEIRKKGVQPVQVLAGIVGLVYLAVGVVGFARTGFSDFTGNQQQVLLGFMINPLHNLVHVVVGAIGLLAAASSGLSRTFGWVLFLAYGVVAIWGLMITGVISTNPVSGLGNPLNLNAADNWLHIGSALVGLIIAIMPARKRVHVPGVAEAPVAADTETTETARHRRGPWYRRGRRTTTAH
ncbi:DUF4383 domain-containing protein [Amycolatopsis sp. K13G38]|uniref:DUF4383 domain-containing protein n=1 Tax=Amycolatopsis acididurans TaxID=2724524 RepID=A0ABX1J4U1_9PSEU|nr:DUF4383 domain-containing protein [Amycolatopsis acididurans]NKQ54813.1 DUF4383 domain-containing protein [Amycolatopsis acididurans]